MRTIDRKTVVAVMVGALATGTFISLSSCTVVVGSYAGQQPHDKNGVTGNGDLNCPPFEMPTFAPVPALPNIPDSVLDNRDKSDTILVNKIDELRKYSKSIIAQIREAQQKHLDSCR